MPYTTQKVAKMFDKPRRGMYMKRPIAIIIVLLLSVSIFSIVTVNVGTPIGGTAVTPIVGEISLLEPDPVELVPPRRVRQYDPVRDLQPRLDLDRGDRGAPQGHGHAFSGGTVGVELEQADRIV